MIVREILSDPNIIDNFDFFNDASDTLSFLRHVNSPESIEIAGRLDVAYRSWLNDWRAKLPTKSSERKCAMCDAVIIPERLEVFPHTERCVACARKNPEPLRHDPNVVCDIGSASARNGWGKNA